MFDDVLKKLYSKYKDEVILGKGIDEVFELKFIPTGLIGLDYVIGKPGIPAWRITQIAGFEDSGKSLLCQWILIQFQKYCNNGIPVYINTEYSYNAEFFEKLGGDPDRLIISTIGTLEKVFAFFEDTVRVVRENYGKNFHILCVIDSLSVAIEQEVQKGEVSIGTHARYLSHIFRKLKAKLYEWNATLIYVSQNKEKISTSFFGGGIARLGGHAVEFAPILTLEVKRQKEEKGDELRHLAFKVKATKNHISIPFRETELLFDFESYRFVNGYNILKILMAKNVITKEKGWYKYNGKSYREVDLIDELGKDIELEKLLRKELGIALEDMLCLEKT